MILEHSLLQRLADDLNPDKDISAVSFKEWCIKTTPFWTWSWPQQEYLYPYLEKFLKGDIKQLMINMPPRHGKTELVTVRLPSYILEKSPTSRVIIGAYNQELVNKFSRKARNIISQRMPLSKERNAANEWETIEGGGLRAVGVGSGITGYGGNILLIDDPTKNREEANSRAYQNKVFNWYKDDLLTRLEPGGKVILTMTRWSYGDLAGRILESDDAHNWTVVNLPALAGKDDPLGRNEGEALCPDRYDKDALLNIKTKLGQSFYALYQGQPVEGGGSIFKQEYWQYYDDLPDRSQWKRVVMSWDTAFKAASSNDYSVCVVFIETSNKIYVSHVMRERLEFPELKRRFQGLVNEHRPDIIYIEDKASGQSLIQELRAATTLPIIAVKVDRDKVTRASTASPTVEAGNIYLPNGKHWVTDFVEELGRFPYGEYDDQVDAFTQGINALRGPANVIW